MKLVNSKDIGKMLEDKADPGDLFNFDEDELASPCWQATVDRDNDALIFLIDSREILRAPLSNLDGEITVDRLSYYIQFLKEGKIKELAKEFKIRTKKRS